MLSGATLLRPPKPASQDAAQRAPEALAKGAGQGRLTRIGADLNHGPAIQRLERAASTLSAGASAAPVQRLKDGTGKSVDISKLSDELVQGLAVAAIEGKTFPGYTFEGGDAEALKAENQKRSQQDRKRRKLAEQSSSSDEEEEEEETKTTGGKLEEKKDEESESEADEDFALTAKEEAVVYLTTEGRRKAGLDKIRYDDKGEEKELKDWPQTGLQGALGEFMAHSKMTKEGHAPTDLNVVALNFKGLDHVSTHPDKPLEQTKLHLSQSTATPETYLGHVKKAPEYAIKAVRDLKRHEKTFKDLVKQPGYSTNVPLQKMIKLLGELEGKSDDDIEGSEVHKLVTGSMRFSVPSDIFDKIDAGDQKHFIRMDMSVAQFQQIMDAMKDDFTPSKPKGSKSNPDEEAYDPEGKG